MACKPFSTASVPPRAPGSLDATRADRAFTLIELLVVLSIIAVLVSLLLPALGKSRRASKAVVCLANLRSIGTSIVLYNKDFQDYYPLSSHTAGSVTKPDAWLQSLEPYGVIRQNRFCPSDAFRSQRLTSFATNDHFEPLTPGIDFNAVTGKRLPGGRKLALNRVFLIPRPSATVYAVEFGGEGNGDHIHSIDWSKPQQVKDAIDVTRHDDSGDYLFADGHSAAVRWSKIQQSFSAETSMFNPETAR